MHTPLENTADIIVLGCFDTKAELFAALYEELRSLGRKVITINTSLLGTTHLFPVDYENWQVISLTGLDLTEVVSMPNRNSAVELMTTAAAILLQKLTDAENTEIGGIVGIGSDGDSNIVLKAMEKVRFGIPKICISTLAAKDVSHFIGSKDIMLVPSVVELGGVNSIISHLLKQTALSLDGMAGKASADTKSGKRIAISVFENTRACASVCTRLLNENGYEVFTFQANGTGCRKMEELIRGGYFNGVLDLTTTELADEICGGICSAGTERLTAAAETGIPQVVVPGGLDMVNFGSPETIPNRYQDRVLYNWSPDITLMRTNFSENMELGNRLSDKLLVSAEPVSVMLPQQGISEIDREGSSFYNERSDKKLFDTIHQKLTGKIQVKTLTYHINDYEFAEALVEELMFFLK